MAKHEPTAAKPIATAFAAMDRIEAQLPLIQAMSAAMGEVAAGRAHPPSEFEAHMVAEKIKAMHFWIGVLKDALCDLEADTGEGRGA